MTLADTSVWVEHYRVGSEALRSLIHKDLLLCHPFVVGELAMGSLKLRTMTLQALRLLPQVLTVRDEEVMLLVETHTLYSKGLSYVDAHLLTASLITADCRLWTYDKRLHEAARKLGLASPLGITQ